MCCHWPRRTCQNEKARTTPAIPQITDTIKVAEDVRSCNTSVTTATGITTSGCPRIDRLRAMAIGVARMGNETKLPGPSSGFAKLKAVPAGPVKSLLDYFHMGRKRLS